MRVFLPISLALMASTIASMAIADQSPGARLAQSCTSCHGTKGAIPALAGRDAGELEKRMLDLAKADADATIMPRLLREYEEAEIKALAAYFAKVKP